MKQIRQIFLEGESPTLSWLLFHDASKVQKRKQRKDQQSCISVFVAHITIPSSK